MSALSDALERDYAPAWRPEPGDKIVGTVVELSERAGYDGELYPILTVAKEDGTQVSVHAFHGVLKSELARLRPEKGAELGIKYLGQVQGEGSRGKYHSYRVKMAGGSSGVNWSRYGDDGDADAAAASSTEPKPSAPSNVVSLADKSAEHFGDEAPF